MLTRNALFAFVLVATIIAITVLYLSAPVTAQSNSIVGAWTLTKTEFSRNGELINTNDSRLPSMLIFTADGYYAELVIEGREPRALWTDETTDEERLASVRRFTANAGSYSIDDNTITYHSTVAKNPSFMNNPDNDDIQTFQLSGNTLTTIESYPNQSTTYTFQRLQ